MEKAQLASSVKPALKVLGTLALYVAIFVFTKAFIDILLRSHGAGTVVAAAITTLAVADRLRR